MDVFMNVNNRLMYLYIIIFGAKMPIKFYAYIFTYFNRKLFNCIFKNIISVYKILFTTLRLNYILINPNKLFKRAFFFFLD